MTVVLQLAEANPCGLHRCGMGSVLNKATRTKMSPPSQVTLQDWLLQVSGSLSVGFALRYAEKRGEKVCPDPSSNSRRLLLGVWGASQPRNQCRQTAFEPAL